MAKAVIYSRQSFGRTDGSAVSIELQEKSCTERAKAMGLDIVGVYSDSNTSSELYPDTEDGRKACALDRGFQRWKKAQRTADNRKEYKAGLGDAFRRIEQGGISYLIVDESTRLYRNADNSYLAGYISEFLLSHNVKVVEAKGGVIDASDDMGRLVTMIRSQIAYDELKHKRENSMRALAKKREACETWSRAKGARMVNGRVQFDDSYRPVITEIFERVARGEGLCRVLNWLNKEHRDKTSGRQWYDHSLYTTLSVGVYAGLMRDGDGWKEASNVDDPIISVGLFLEVQRQLALHKTGAKVTSRKPLPWSGYIKCHCGRRMAYFDAHGVSLYRCMNAGEHRNTIRMSDPDQKQDLSKSLQTLCILRLFESVSRLENTHDDEKGKLELELQRLKNSLKAKMRMVESDEDYEMFKDEIDGVKARIKAVESEITNHKVDEDETVANTLLRDFSALANGDNLEEDSLYRLVRETFRGVTVESDHITIELWEGTKFDLPRITVGSHGKKIVPWSSLIVTGFGGKRKVLVRFHLDGATEDTVLADGVGWRVVIGE